MEELRANPDEILNSIRKNDRQKQRGHLKIFFGYAAGVGKTFAMLKAAHSAKRRGVDVVVGYVEPHHRLDTISLLSGLEQLPIVEVIHKGITLREFNLDLAIKRKPKLILVDELAHTNADVSRHNKRYQDIEELLSHGIDVYTTVNVQHIESLNDIVSSITGVKVTERIPDKVFDDSNQVELVDIEPEELIERLKAGKIYKKAQAQNAINNFFNVKNLIALREIALRRCADRINKMSDKVRSATDDDYYTDEHILVCLSSSPSNQRIIRTAARMANAFKASFTALFVETPCFSEMSEKNINRLRDNIKLAEQLGATIETVFGDDIAFQISEFARLSGVSKIVLGRSNVKKRHFWNKPTLTEKLTETSPNLDIYVIPDSNVAKYKNKPVNRTRNNKKVIVADILKSLAVLATATLVGFLFYNLDFSEANIITVYILSVLITSIITSRREYSLISAVLSVITFNFFFTEPILTLKAYDKGYPTTFLIMLVSAFITSTLAVKIKNNAKASAATAYRTKLLFETNQLLQKAKTSEDIVLATANQLTKLLNKNIVFYLVENENISEAKLFLYDNNKNKAKKSLLSENEKAVAYWVFKNNKHAGATTNTLCSAKCLYLAVRVNEKVFGVVGIEIAGVPLEAFENSFVLSIIGECALALENDKAIREREQAAVIAKNEQLRANLLRSISHDLRTPLTSISGSAGILLSNSEEMTVEKRKQLYSDIYDDSLWLINLVENLLSVTRIENGTMKLNLNTEILDEVIGEALDRVKRKSINHKINFIQSDDFILVKIDLRLIIQVLINIIDNAIKYTPIGSEITIKTSKKDGMAQIEIADNGEGIDDNIKPKIFDMFFTANSNIADSRRSMGLGLALCKSIVNAHKGEIFVCNNKPVGTIFKFTLPSEEVTIHE